MTDPDSIDGLVADIAGKLHACNRCSLRRRSREREYVLPNRKAVHHVLDTFIGVLFPGCHGHGPIEHDASGVSIEEELKSATHSLREQVEMAYEYECELDSCGDDCVDCEDQADDAVRHLVESLPRIQDMLQEDIQAAYDGDPAAKSTMEIVMSYPAIQAITAYRIAHALYERKVPLIARIMTELAHSRTGIDIHPGAEIGRRFFIDHGTGVVIGETSVIGDNVKIYQGVTLGAMSFPKDDEGQPVKGMKRHPNVGSNVTIYAEATILGDITIGEGSTIGGNVWLTYSVPPNSKVQNIEPGPKVMS